MDWKVSTERRRHKRFNAPEGSFAVIKNHVSKLGQIIDVSMRGLAFKYIENGKQPNRMFKMDILLSGPGIYSKNIPFKTISDFDMKSENPSVA